MEYENSSSPRLSSYTSLIFILAIAGFIIYYGFGLDDRMVRLLTLSFGAVLVIFSLFQMIPIYIIWEVDFADRIVNLLLTFGSLIIIFLIFIIAFNNETIRLLSAFGIIGSVILEIRVYQRYKDMIKREKEEKELQFQD